MAVFVIVAIARLGCYPASATGTYTITQGGQLQITCSLYTLLSASLISGGAQLGFSTITSTFPANRGVAYVVNGQSYTALSGAALSLGSLNLLTLSANGVFSFSVLLSAPCNATPGPASIVLGTALDVNLLGLGVSTGLGPSVTMPPNVQSGIFGAVTATFVNSATPVSFGTVQITGLSGETKTGSARLSVNRPACAGATVTVEVTGRGGNFNPPAGGGGLIPHANLSLTSVSSSPSDSGLTVASLPGGGTAGTTNPTQRIDRNGDLHAHPRRVSGGPGRNPDRDAHGDAAGHRRGGHAMSYPRVIAHSRVIREIGRSPTGRPPPTTTTGGEPAR